MPWWTEEEFGLSLVISLLLRGTTRESMLLCVPFEKGGKDSMISSHLYLLCKWDVTIFFQNSFAVLPVAAAKGRYSEENKVYF